MDYQCLVNRIVTGCGRGIIGEAKTRRRGMLVARGGGATKASPVRAGNTRHNTVDAALGRVPDISELRPRPGAAVR